MKSIKNIVIIGAGPSGLTAALEILRRSDEYTVTVLEADAIIGGISRTVKVSGGHMDIGGHRFYTKSDRVFEFWKSLMPLQGAPALDEIKTSTFNILEREGADPEITDAVLLNRRRVSRIYRKGRFYDYPVSLSTVRAMGLQSVGAFISYLWAKITPRRENTLEDFYINRFGKMLYSIFFESYTEKVWGLHPSEIPPDWGAQRVKGLSVWSVLKDMLTKGKSEETSLIKSFLYPKFGPGQMWECAAKEISERLGKILLNSPVERVTVKNGQVISVTAGGIEYAADILISSMPLAELIAAVDGEEPPCDVRMTAENLHFRDFITVGVEAKRLKIKNKTKYKTVGDIPPDCWIYVQDPDVKMGRLQIFNNWSPYMVDEIESRVLLGTEYFCTQGEALWSMSDEEICVFASRELVKMGIINEEDIRSLHCRRMKKAYPAYNGGYRDINKLHEFCDSIENLYCVGRNGQHRYNNMDHSMLTAMTAADIILEGGEKSSVWYVNPDGEYGE